MKCKSLLKKEKIITIIHKMQYKREQEKIHLRYNDSLIFIYIYDFKINSD